MGPALATPMSPRSSEAVANWSAEEATVARSAEATTERSRQLLSTATRSAAAANLCGSCRPGVA